MSIFDTILVKKLKRATFDLSHDVKLTCNFGKLVPFMCEETVPGDTWYNKSTLLARFSPLIAPVMHKMYITTHFFYVPFRLVWDDYEIFETGGKDGKQTVQFPYMPMLGTGYEGYTGEFKDTEGLWKHGTLADYLNYPTSEENEKGCGTVVSSLPFRAYQLIYNEYYRDENLEEELNIPMDSREIKRTDADYKELLTLRTRAWHKDYFTSALPWPQKGADVLMPTATVGKVDNTAIAFNGMSGYSGQARYVNPYTGESESQGFSVKVERDSSTETGFNKFLSTPFDVVPDAAGTYPLGLDNSGNLKLADDGVTIDGTSFTINDLRRASRAQAYLEARARGGNRYKETLLSIFGKTVSDGRLMRPEFLGGGNTPVQVSDILQTSETTSSSPQGQYAGLGYAFGDSNSFKRTFDERGYIIGIMSVMPECGYTEGCPRAYRKFHNDEYYIPQFANLGEDKIYKYELSLRGDHNTSSLTDEFGYKPRYAEYKYIPNRVHGDFKDMNSYGYWTLNRHFSTMPKLNNEFIKCDDEADDLNRIFAVEDASVPKILVQIQNHTKARRPMPYFADPKLS